MSDMGKLLIKGSGGESVKSKAKPIFICGGIILLIISVLLWVEVYNTYSDFQILNSRQTGTTGTITFNDARTLDEAVQAHNRRVSHQWDIYDRRMELFKQIFLALFITSVATYVPSIGSRIHKSMKNTKIRIYERGVTGSTISWKYVFLNSKTRVCEFTITYDQIFCVKLNQEQDSIIIKGYGFSYAVFTQDAKKIQQAIHRQKNALQQKQ
jgi:hypothetical protein